MAALLKCFFLVALLGATYNYVECNDTCKETWKDVTNAIKEGSKESFVNHVGPLAQMAKTAYTANTGEEIPGWQLVQEFKMINGLYALAYKSETDSNKLVLAFRGIRFGDNDSGGTEDDLCARFYLMDAGLECSDDKRGLPESCKRIPGWVLDYLNQARIFIAQLRATYPDECFLYTGHSLGATLSSILSATSRGFESHAVSFAPSPSNVPQIVTNLGIDADYSRVITLFDEYDGNVDLDKCKYGIRCRFEGPEPEACATCTADKPFPDISEVLADMQSPCELCLHHTHFFSHILKTINDEGTQRPQCYEQDCVAIPFAKEDQKEDTVERRLLDLLSERFTGPDDDGAKGR
ncbi:uncharacterized protein [Amphiura filiformis]|uniref:uncharacterized protein n=1 Tax=Amphiura filiformis TaxID=82378 RepID=UPI003B2157B4